MLRTMVRYSESNGLFVWLIRPLSLLLVRQLNGRKPRANDIDNCHPIGSSSWLSNRPVTQNVPRTLRKIDGDRLFETSLYIRVTNEKRIVGNFLRSYETRNRLSGRNFDDGVIRVCHSRELWSGIFGTCTNRTCNPSDCVFGRPELVNCLTLFRKHRDKYEKHVVPLFSLAKCVNFYYDYYYEMGHCCTNKRRYDLLSCRYAHRWLWRRNVASIDSKMSVFL